jgi:hypothetical protein
MEAVYGHFQNQRRLFEEKWAILVNHFPQIYFVNQPCTFFTHICRYGINASVKFSWRLFTKVAHWYDQCGYHKDAMSLVKSKIDGLKQGSLAKLSKHPGIGKYELFALLIIALAIGLRLLLTALGWPTTNSDEGTIGLMARHIAYNGEHPVVFYSRNYLGAVEAYLGAAFFRLLGPSVFTLRLGIMLLDALFFASMYLLTSLLYTKKLALYVLILLSMGSSAMFLRELYATGGSTQTLLFGTLAFLLAAWLALTYRQDLPRGRRWLRFAGYAGWGLVVGLGIWSDLVVLPILLMASLLLLLFCWRDLRSLVPLCLLSGFIIGVFPLIVYNLQAAHGQDSLSMIIGLFQGGKSPSSVHTLPQLIRGIEATLDMSLPTATGDPFCQAAAVDYASDASSHAFQCRILHTGWSTGYTILWTLAVSPTVSTLWKLRGGMQAGSSEWRQEIVLHFARLCLLASAAVALVSYAVSSGPQSLPHSHARYLLTLLIVTPALIWPIWSAASTPLAKDALEQRFTRLRSAAILNRGILLLIVMLFLIGTISIASDLSSSQQANQQQDELIARLEQMGITHIYSDFWTCNRITFVSQEKIICGVTDSALMPSHNYYASYYAIVHADPHSAYVYTYDIFQKADLLHKADVLRHGFRRFVFAGYIIYQPV